MKFVKGIMLGSALTVGAIAMYNEGLMNPKKIMKKGKKMVKKIGII